MKPILENYLKEFDLKFQSPTVQEISNLFKIVQRDLENAQIEPLSADRKFATAYNAALQLTVIVLRTKGFRTNPGRAGHHKVCFQITPLLMGKEVEPLTNYFNVCRIKRHACDYLGTDEATPKEALLLIKEVEKFRGMVIHWLMQNHKDLLPIIS